MKKYDIFIAAAYIIIIFALLIDISKESKNLEAMIVRSSELTEDKVVRAVVISNTDAFIEICPLEQDSIAIKNWAIKGFISGKDIYNMNIENDTLRIDGPLDSSLKAVIKLQNLVSVEIINAPNVICLTDEEYATRSAEDSSRYDF
ncbi:MAG: hypothetical protein SNG49_08305 [Rikenellaceae bacterium]